MLKRNTWFWKTRQNAITPRWSGRSTQSRLSWKFGMPRSMFFQGVLGSCSMYSQCRLGPKIKSWSSFWINQPILRAKATSMATLAMVACPPCTMLLLSIFSSRSEPCCTHFPFHIPMPSLVTQKLVSMSPFPLLHFQIVDDGPHEMFSIHHRVQMINVVHLDEGALRCPLPIAFHMPFDGKQVLLFGNQPIEVGPGIRQGQTAQAHFPSSPLQVLALLGKVT